MVQRVKCLVCKPEDPSLDPQHLLNKLGAVPSLEGRQADLGLMVILDDDKLCTQ